MRWDTRLSVSPTPAAQRSSSPQPDPFPSRVGSGLYSPAAKSAMLKLFCYFQNQSCHSLSPSPSCCYCAVLLESYQGPRWGRTVLQGDAQWWQADSPVAVQGEPAELNFLSTVKLHCKPWACCQQCCRFHSCAGHSDFLTVYLVKANKPANVNCQPWSSRDPLPPTRQSCTSSPTLWVS